MPAPTLFYYNSEPSIELSRETAIPAGFSFDVHRPNSLLEIILVQFALNGTFIGMMPLTSSVLNVCLQQNYPLHFGALYRTRCSLQLWKLLRLVEKESIFCDLYIAFMNAQGKMQMYAIPVLNENIRRNGEYVNRLARNELSHSKWILTRRIYFVDAVSLDNELSEQNSSIIRFPEEISIRIQIQPQKDGRIMPPYVRIRHGETRHYPDAVVTMQCDISYFMDGSKFFRDMEIVLFVLSALSIIYAAISTYSWGRRSGKMIVDSTIIIKLVLFECDILGDVLAFSVLAPAIFITFAYKAQQVPYYSVFNEKQARIACCPQNHAALVLAKVPRTSLFI